MGRFHIFLGLQLLNTFCFPEGESFIVEAATAGAAMLYMSNQHQLEPASDPLCIRTVARNGSLLAEHLFNFALSFCQTLTSGWQEGSLLALAKTGETLFVLSPRGHLQAIGLGRPAAPADQLRIQASSCNGLAAVCFMGYQSEVLLVDLPQQCVTHRYGLPDAAVWEDSNMSLYKYPALAHSSRRLAYCFKEGGEHQTRVAGLGGHSAGLECFVLPGVWSPSWDWLGQFLAVLKPGSLSTVWICVYSAAGTCLASLLPPMLDPCCLFQVQWQPERSELRCVGRQNGHVAPRSMFICSF